MAIPAGTGVPIDSSETSSVEQQQREQSNPSFGSDGLARRPQREDVSTGARDYLDGLDKGKELIGDNYKDKDEALSILTYLNRDETEKLRTDPSVLGELRDGVDTKSVKTGELAVLGDSLSLAETGHRREAANFEEGQMSYDRRKRQEHEVGMMKSTEARANDSLNGTMSISHHASI